jgi:hypothetical protein
VKKIVVQISTKEETRVEKKRERKRVTMFKNDVVESESSEDII